MDRPLRILMLTPGYHPLIGGAETHVRLLAEEMARVGHEVTVLSHGGRLPAQERLNGVDIVRTRSNGEWRSSADRVPWEDLQFGLCAEVETLLGDLRFDGIHSHCQAAALLGSLIRRRYARFQVASFHETEPDREALGESRSTLIHSALGLDAVIAGSDFFVEQARRFGVPSDRLYKVMMGIDVERWSPERTSPEQIAAARARLGVPMGVPLVLLVGRFKPRKGLVEFVDSIKLARSHLPELRGAIVGSGNSASRHYRTTVERAISQAGLQRSVTLLEDAFSNEEMPALLAAADVIAQPSHVEGLGLSAIEALAAERPLVAADAPGLREVVRPGRDGLLITVSNPQALADGIVKMLSDRKAACALAASGRRRVSSLFSIQRTTQQTLEIYGSVMTAQVSESTDGLSRRKAI